VRQNILVDVVLLGLADGHQLLQVGAEGLLGPHKVSDEREHLRREQSALILEQNNDDSVQVLQLAAYSTSTSLRKIFLARGSRYLVGGWYLSKVVDDGNALREVLRLRAGAQGLERLLGEGMQGESSSHSACRPSGRSREMILRTDTALLAVHRSEGAARCPEPQRRCEYHALGHVLNVKARRAPDCGAPCTGRSDALSPHAPKKSRVSEAGWGPPPGPS
jgi:hypothetical protein